MIGLWTSASQERASFDAYETGSSVPLQVALGSGLYQCRGGLAILPLGSLVSLGSAAAPLNRSRIGWQKLVNSECDWPIWRKSTKCQKPQEASSVGCLVRFNADIGRSSQHATLGPLVYPHLRTRGNRYLGLSTPAPSISVWMPVGGALNSRSGPDLRLKCVNLPTEFHRKGAGAVQLQVESAVGRIVYSTSCHQVEGEIRANGGRIGSLTTRTQTA